MDFAFRRAKIENPVKAHQEEELPAPEAEENDEIIPDDELKRLIACLKNDYPVISRNAAAYFHHVTYQNPRVKERLAIFHLGVLLDKWPPANQDKMETPNSKWMRTLELQDYILLCRDLDGIQHLSDLVLSSDVETRLHSIGALRNFSYQPSPLVVYKLRQAAVIAKLVTALEQVQVDVSPSNGLNKAELEDAIAAVLCNLSAHDNFRKEIIDSTIPILMNAIILPHSGLPQQRQETEVFSDEPSADSAPEAPALVFATGTVRNVLTETADCRHRLRETPGLVAALIYLCKCLAHAGEFDSRVLENCVCALRNLSFALQEVRDPAYLTRREAGFYVAATCVPNERRLDFHRKPKAGLVLDTTKDTADQSLQDQPSYMEMPPSASSLFHGSHLLWQPEIVQVYLSVLRGCKNPCTVEAVAGAIQNLAACDWRPSMDIRRRVSRNNVFSFFSVKRT
ncbi:unnamed protein product [Dibothriocephalus latus]|uniref:Uncharacterized protein n=1 Tax=Dibothriocephalus latus TaxID=60516 RepID=A0A3P6STD9_DIBLA|nr:unnamed protein product [Dibothriocephalus latus]